MLVQGDSRDLPRGKTFVRSYGVWIFSESLETLFLWTEDELREFQISDLRLTASDSIHSVDFIKSNEVIFIYATRNTTPTAFLVGLSTTPRVLSVALDTITFHTTILDAFVPVEGAFCVVSVQGVSLHRMDLGHTFAVYNRISACCHDGPYLMVFSPEHKTLDISRFDPSGPSRTPVHRVTGWMYPVPKQLVSLSNSLVLLSYDRSSDVILHKCEFDGKLKTHQASFDIEFPSFHPFDGGMIVSSLEKNRAVLVDVFDINHSKVGASFDWPLNMIGVCGSRWAVYDGVCREIVPNYGDIGDCTVEMISALFRRTGGVVTACAQLKRQLRNVKSVQEMKRIVQSIGPSVMKPDIQLRVAHAIQFSGIMDPHVILLGLLEFLQMLGNRAILETRKVVTKAMIHPLCRNAVGNLLATQFKMDMQMLRCVISECGDSLFIDISHVEDILDYAEVCIEFGQMRKAKRLLLRATLDENPAKERIEILKKKLV